MTESLAMALVEQVHAFCVYSSPNSALYDMFAEAREEARSIVAEFSTGAVKLSDLVDKFKFYVRADCITDIVTFYLGYLLAEQIVRFDATKPVVTKALTKAIQFESIPRVANLLVDHAAKNAELMRGVVSDDGPLFADELDGGQVVNYTQTFTDAQPLVESEDEKYATQMPVPESADKNNNTRRRNRSNITRFAAPSQPDDDEDLLDTSMSTAKAQPAAVKTKMQKKAGSRTTTTDNWIETRDSSLDDEFFDMNDRTVKFASAPPPPPQSSSSTHAKVQVKLEDTKAR